MTFATAPRILVWYGGDGPLKSNAGAFMNCCDHTVTEIGGTVIYVPGCDRNRISAVRVLKR